MYSKIPLINACDFSDEIREYCTKRDIETYYRNDVAWISNDNNPFWKWLIEIGEANNNQEGMWIAILGT